MSSRRNSCSDPNVRQIPDSILYGPKEQLREALYDLTYEELEAESARISKLCNRYSMLLGQRLKAIGVIDICRTDFLGIEAASNSNDNFEKIDNITLKMWFQTDKAKIIAKLQHMMAGNIRNTFWSRREKARTDLQASTIWNLYRKNMLVKKVLLEDE